MINATATSKGTKMFAIIVQDESSFDAQDYDVAPNVESAQMIVEDLIVDSYCNVIDVADGHAKALALLDIDGRLVEAKWIDNEGTDELSLVAIVEVI